MPRLHYCNTIYDYNPIQDVNPLILQRYFDGQVLVLCAREGQVTRVNKMLASNDYSYTDQVVLCYGWWDVSNMGLFLPTGELVPDELMSYDAVVILDRHRIDPIFLEILDVVETACKTLLSPRAS